MSRVICSKAIELMWTEMNAIHTRNPCKWLMLILKFI